MAFEPIREEWRQQYLKRSLDKLPGDLAAACDQLRHQRNEMGKLRADLEGTKAKLKWAKWKNNILMASLGGAAAEGMKVAVTHLIKVFAP